MDVDVRKMTFSKMFQKYPEMEEDLRILRNNINAKGFWSMIICIVTGITIGFITAFIIGVF
jgi:hypothetical protein